MRNFLRLYLIVALGFAAWVAFWVAGDAVTQPVVEEQHDDTPLSVCGTDTECEMFDRRHEVRW